MSKVRKIDGDQEPFWRMVIETWQASGLSARQFCKQENLVEPSFYAWRKKLAGGSMRGDTGKPKPSAFIEVSMPQCHLAAVELVLASGAWSSGSGASSTSSETPRCMCRPKPCSCMVTQDIRDIFNAPNGDMARMRLKYYVEQYTKNVS